MPNVSLRDASTLSRKLKNLSPQSEFLFLILILMSFYGSVAALKLFPNKDAFNALTYLYSYIISSLLNGTIPYWDPMAACGSPLYLSFMSLGILDPIFAVSVFFGKIFSLNVFQICMMWYTVSQWPVLFGMFWLLKMLCRHSTVALCGGAFVYYTMALFSLQLTLPFVAYWPLLLALAVYFFRSLKYGRVSIVAYYGFITVLGINLLMYNPAYTFVYLGCVIAAGFIVRPRQFIFLAMLFWKKITPRRKIVGMMLLILLVSPAAVLFGNYRQGEHFAYVRVHTAQSNVGRSISLFNGESLDYVETDSADYPMRRGREFTGSLFPFYYLIDHIADGTVYLGLLSALGLMAGIAFARQAAFYIFGLGAMLVAFLMTWSSAQTWNFLILVFPFLKIINQHQLLYPAFIILMTVAVCLGLCTLLEIRRLKQIMRRMTFQNVFVAGAVFLAAGALFSLVTGANLKEGLELIQQGSWRLYVVFVAVLIAVSYLSRMAVKRRGAYRALVLFLLFIFLADLGFYTWHLTAGADKNTGIFAKSAWLRKPLDLKFQPFRSPLLPAIYGGTQANSIVHQINLRSALPAYWNCDVMFSSKRYYDLISTISSNKLKSLLCVTSPVLRIFSQKEALDSQTNALGMLLRMSPIEVEKTILLQPVVAELQNNWAAKLKRAFEAPVVASKYFPATGPHPEQIDRSFYTNLYDDVVTVPHQDYEKTSQGIYHKSFYRIKFPKDLTIDFNGPEDLLSRFFIPDFPIAADINGEVCFISADRRDFMKIVPGEGFLIESDSTEPYLPSKFYRLKKRSIDMSQLTVMDFGVNHLSVRTAAQDPSVLAYFDLFDQNWRATVDGIPAQIFIADHAFKAVRIPAGKHTVEFRYHVPFLFPAILVYFLCVAGFFLVLVSSLIKRKCNIV